MYQVEFMPEAEDDLTRLSPDIATRVLKKAKWLADNFDQITLEALTGQWRGVFKLRVGDYRALYTFVKGDPGTITFHLVKHRREVYDE